MYIPQPIAIHTSMERQNFRKGECKPFDNLVLYSAPNIVMPAVVIKRAVSGATATATLVDLNDNDIWAVTLPSQTSWPLDDEGEFEALVISAGNWVGAASLMTGTRYYFRIEAGTFTYYTDEIYLEQNNSGFPLQCDGQTIVKIYWVLDGTCIVAGKTTANDAEPVHGYPKTPLIFSVFWKANLSQPEWETEVVDEPDAHGQPVVKKRSLKKVWTVEGVPVSEGFADALAISALSDTVAVAFPDGIAFTGCRDIRTDVSWNNGGCSASLKFKFTTDYFVKLGCCG